METTLPYVKQLFNVKGFAYNTNINDLQEGQTGIYAEGSQNTIASGTTFATLPERFRIVSKLGGKLYMGMDTISKSTIRNKSFTDARDEVQNKWKISLDHSCGCVKSAKLTVQIDEAFLESQQGLSWNTNDYAYVFEPSELDCLDCDDTKTHQNNIFVKLLAQRLNERNSDAYKASVGADTSAATTYATVTAMNGASGMDRGDLAITTSTSNLYVYNGSAWVLVGTSDGELSNVDLYLENVEGINTDTDTGNDGAKLYLLLEGKPKDNQRYADLDINYQFPMGVKLTPVLVINNRRASTVEQLQPLVFSRGKGADVRSEEWENMNHYTTLNHYPRLSDGIQSNDLVYQFENGKDYDILNFEFTAPKVVRNNGEVVLHGVIMGAEKGSSVSAQLEAIFS